MVVSAARAVLGSDWTTEVTGREAVLGSDWTTEATGRETARWSADMGHTSIVIIKRAILATTRVDG